MATIPKVPSLPSDLFERVGRAIYAHIDLDAIVHNTLLMKKLANNPSIGVIAVLKCDSYGHGAVAVGNHLRKTGAAERIAVATVAEGVDLRRGGVNGPVHIFGNIQAWEILRCLKYDLIPSVCDVAAVKGMADALRKVTSDYNCNSVQRAELTSNGTPRGAVHIKLDTGMSRNGCQPADLQSLLKTCDALQVPVEGVFSHLADYLTPDNYRPQLDAFEEAAQQLKSRGLVLHLSAAGPALKCLGTQYDFIRPGITLLGQPADLDPVEVKRFQSLGFRPSFSLIGRPTLVKLCSKGTRVGYGCTYTCDTDMWVATIPIGYADGYRRTLGNNAFVRRNKTGEVCPVIGRISMDAITVKLPCQPDPDETFAIVTADFDSQTSVMAMCERVGSIPQEVLALFSRRIPRVYTSSDQPGVIVREALDLPVDTDCVTNPSGVIVHPY